MRISQIILFIQTRTCLVCTRCRWIDKCGSNWWWKYRQFVREIVELEISSKWIDSSEMFCKRNNDTYRINKCSTLWLLVERSRIWNHNHTEAKIGVESCSPSKEIAKYRIQKSPYLHIPSDKNASLLEISEVDSYWIKFMLVLGQLENQRTYLTEKSDNIYSLNKIFLLIQAEMIA